MPKVSGPKIAARQGAPTTARNRGTQGYPVPPEQLAQVAPNPDLTDVVEDVVINQIVVPTGVVAKDDPVDVVDAAKALDIVKNTVLSDLVPTRYVGVGGKGPWVAEADDPEGKEKKDLGFGFNEDGFAIQDKYEFQGLPIAVENKKGSTRHYRDEKGNIKGSTKMYCDYGYVEGAIGADGEPVDVYVGEDDAAEYAFVVHQNKAPKFEEYDEDKVMLGFPDEGEAKKAYLRQYNDPRFYGGMSSMPMEKFKAKLQSGGKITNEGWNRVVEAGFAQPRPERFTGDDGGLPEEFRMQMMRVLHGHRDKLKARGCPPGMEIGRGTQGIAYDCGGNKVLKVTVDRDEAEASMKIRGKKMKHVVHVFDVFKFPGKKLFKSDADELFGVVQEKLAKLSNKESADFEQASRYLEKVDHFWEQLPPETFAKKLEEKIAKYPEMAEQFRWAAGVAEKFGCRELAAELKSHGIEWVDMHAGNIMKRGQDYVAVDLGASDVDAPPPVPTLENVVAEVETFGQGVTKLLTPEIVAKLEKRGIKLSGKSLGSGTQGSALEATYKGQSVVLKITADETEALASSHINGKPVKHLPRVFDVFAFPNLKNPDFPNRWGILQEKLQPINDAEAAGVKKMVTTIKMLSNGDTFLHEGDFDGLLAAVQENLPNRAQEFEKLTHHFQFGEILKELRKHRINYYDYHPGNIMRRGSDYVVIDLGYSTAPRTAIQTLEQAVTEGLLNVLREAKADQVGVTVGRFQPFHRGHADLVRELAGKFSKVILVVGGLKKGEENPFSFKLRERMMKASLPDVISKVEIHEATYSGQNSGFLPGILSDVIDQNESSLDKGMAVQILVAADMVQDVKRQLAQAQAMRADGKELSFDPGLATVVTVPNASEDGNGKASGKAIIQALEQGDEKTVAKMVDPHLLSNPTEFHDIYSELRKELGVRGVNESIEAAGGQRSIEETMDQHQDKLNARKPFPIKWPSIKELGHGADGYAYDMGGNKVFKVTTEPTEAVSSLALKGQNMKHVVRIFDVFRFPPTQGTQGSRVPLFGIVTEKLQPLSTAEKAEFSEAIAWVMDPSFKQTTRQRIVRGDFEGAMRDIEQHMVRLFQSGQISEAMEPTANARVGGRVSPTNTPSPTGTTDIGDKKKPFVHGRKMNAQEARAAAKRKAATVRAMLEHFSIPEICKELSSKGISFFDYHSENLMKRGSTYVINDLGRSDMKGGAEPPLLEKIAESVLDEFGPFSGPGNTAVGAKAGRSAWSASINQVDPDSEELWQNQLKRLNVKIGDTQLPDTIKNDPKVE